MAADGSIQPPRDDRRTLPDLLAEFEFTLRESIACCLDTLADYQALRRRVEDELGGQVEELRAELWSGTIPNGFTIEPPANGPEVLLTARQVAEWLKLSTDQVYSMHRSGTIPGVRLGERRLRFSRSRVADALRVKGWQV